MASLEVQSHGARECIEHLRSLTPLEAQAHHERMLRDFRETAWPSGGPMKATEDTFSLHLQYGPESDEVDAWQQAILEDSGDVAWPRPAVDEKYEQKGALSN